VIVKKSAYGVITTSGKEVLPADYKFIRYNSENNVFLVQNYSYPDGYMGVLNTSGQPIIPLEYANMWISDKTNLLVFEKDNKYGIMNFSKELVLPPTFNYIMDLKGIYLLQVNNRYRIFNPKQKNINNNEYDLFQSYREYQNQDKFSAVKRNGKWGYIDSMGAEIIAPAYDTVFSFSGYDVAYVGNKDKYGMIDRSGKVLIPVKYQAFLGFSEGLMGAVLNNKIGYIDIEGKEIIPFIYDDAELFKNSKAKVKQGEAIFFIDKTGKKVE
jgi:hypothetical protein